MDPARPLRRLGRYVLFGALAEGGMASVHFGRLLGAGGFARTVAIKRLHPQFGEAPELVKMLLDEARIVSRVQHTNVVPTLDLVEAERELFLVMEYVAGESLARLLRTLASQRATTPVPVAVAITAGMLHGLHAAHTARSEMGEPLAIVHRDVTPHNVLVGTDGQARMLDFGVAKARGRLQTTRGGHAKGKLPYMAPEQITCDTVTPSTDVYAAGVVLWEALTARRLFHGDHEGHVVHRVLEGMVEPPSAYAPQVPPEIDRIVGRALARDAAERHRSALELADALEAVVSPATTRQVSRWLEETASEALAARAEQLAQIERVALAIDDAPSTTPLPGLPPSRPSSDRGERTVTEPWAGSVGARSPATNGERDAPVFEVETKAGLPRPSAEVAARGRRQLVLPIAAATVAVLGVGAFALLQGRSSATPAAPSDPRPEQAVPVAATEPVIAPEPPQNSAAAPPAASSAAREAPVAPPPVRARPSQPAKKATQQAGCDPPWVTGSDGIKRWKPGCK